MNNRSENRAMGIFHGWSRNRVIKATIVVFCLLLTLGNAVSASGISPYNSRTLVDTSEALSSLQSEIDVLEEQLKQGFREYAVGIDNWMEYRQLEASYYRSNFNIYLYLNLLQQEMLELRKGSSRTLKTQSISESIEEQISNYNLSDGAAAQAYRMTARKLAEIESAAVVSDE